MKSAECPVTDSTLVERLLNVPRSSLNNRMRSLQQYVKKHRIASDAIRGEIYHHFYRPASRAA